MTHIDIRGDEIFQHTLADQVSIKGVGLHSGELITLTLRPAAPDTGILFVRDDLPADQAVIEAAWDRVVDTRMCTVIANDHGARVGTIEHLMAALSAMGIDNLEIHLNGAEVPIMDGSSAPFIKAIAGAGRVTQDGLRQAVRVLKTVEVRVGDKVARFEPAKGPSFSFAIDFGSRAIGRQRRAMTLNADTFTRDVAAARTFGFLHEVEAMRAMGLARGGSLDNAVVIDGDEIMNTDGLRFDDEFVRHKILDAVGDIYLAGCRIVAHYHGEKAGHDMNNKLLRALFADPTAWTLDTPVATVASSWRAGVAA